MTCGTPYSSEARWPAKLAYQVCECTRSAALAAGRDRQVDAEGAQRGVGAGQLGEVGVRRRAGLVPWRTEGVHAGLHVVAGSQRPDQLGDVHTCAAVDLGRVLLGQDVDAQGCGRYRAPGRPSTSATTECEPDRHDCPRAQEGPGHRPRRRRGQATDAADGRPGQAGGPVRRHLPADRLRAVQRRQPRLPPGRRADAVQVAQPRPARHPDLADVHAARQLRHPGPGAAAGRQALVPRQRRRDLPVAQPAQRREARHRRGGRRRPRLPDGLLPDGRAARRVAAPPARWPRSGSRSRWPTSSA